MQEILEALMRLEDKVDKITEDNRQIKRILVDLAANTLFNRK